MEEFFRLEVDNQLQLRELNPIDAQDIFTTIDTQRDYLGEWLPFVAGTQSLADSQHYIDYVLSQSAELREFVFTIRYNDQFVGLIGLKKPDYLNRITEIGYWLSEPFQKKGLVTRSCKALIDFAFIELDMNRIQIKVAVGNTASQRVVDRLGFRFEGVERQGEWLNDRYVDLNVHSLLKVEYV